MAYVMGDPEKIREGVPRIEAAVAQANSCPCMRCRSRGLTGPVVLITLGVLFMLGEFHVARFGSTWPVLLIVIGLMKVLAGNLDNTGHVEFVAPAAGGPPPAPPSPPPANTPQNPASGEVNHV